MSISNRKVYTESLYEMSISNGKHYTKCLYLIEKSIRKLYTKIVYENSVRKVYIQPKSLYGKSISNRKV